MRRDKVLAEGWRVECRLRSYVRGKIDETWYPIRLRRMR